MSTGKTTVMLEDFSDGIDRREGKVCRDTKKFHDILNFQITPGRKLKRRVPCDLLPGSLIERNVWYLNGNLVCFRSRLNTGSSNVTGLRSGIGQQTVYYDYPPNCLEYSAPNVDEVIDAGILNGHIVALVKHYHLSGQFALYVHVFDEPTATTPTKPTYVSDGAPPCFWTPLLPQHPYGKEDPGAATSYAPRLGVDNGRVYISKPDGNVGYSAIARPRVFNERSAEQILRDGRWTYILPVGDGLPSGDLNEVMLDIDYLKLVEDDTSYTPAWSSYGGYAEYGLEYLGADGVWVQYADAGPGVALPASGKFSIRNAALLYWLTAMDGSAKCLLAFTLPAAAAGRPHRFYAKAKPTGIIVSGCTVQGDGTISPGSITWKGRTYSVPEIARPPSVALVAALGLTTGQSSFIGFSVNDANPDAPSFTYVWSKLQPRDGTVICAQAIVESSLSFRYPTATAGTVSYNITSPTTVTGAGTSFTTQFNVNERPGGYITVETSAGVFQTRRVTAIGSNASLTIDRGFTLPPGSTTFSGRLAYNSDVVLQTLRPSGYLVTQGSKVVKLVPHPAYGNLGLPPEALIGATVTLRYAAGSTFDAKVVQASFVANSEYTLTLDTASPGSYLAPPNDPTAQFALIPYTPLFTPAYAFQDGGTPFFQDREADAVLAAGAGDAGFVASAQHDGTGEVPVALGSAQNRLFVQYPQCVLLFGLGATFVPSFLAKQAVGAGGVDKPAPVMVDDGLMLPTEFGPRMFFPAGNNKDYMQYAAFGDRLNGIALPLFKAAAWWQNQSVYVTAGVGAADGVLWVLTFNREAKVRGWSRWTINALTQIDKLIVAAGTLLVVANKRIYQFNPAATTFKDSVDTSPAYKSSAKWLYSDYGRPRDNKKLTRLEVAGNGKATVGFYVSAADDTDQVTQVPVVEGYTQGVRKVPLLLIGAVIAPYIETTDESGMELFSLGFDHTPVRR